MYHPVGAPVSGHFDYPESSSNPEDLVVSTSLSFSETKQVLQACSESIHVMLDLEQIFRYLYSYNLLTDTEQDMLQTSTVECSRKKKIMMLITNLPRKGSDALQRFVQCLLQSGDGTGHEDLAMIVKQEADKVINARSKRKEMSGI